MDIVVKRIAVIKFWVDDRSGTIRCSFGIEVRIDTTKLTNVMIAWHGESRDLMWKDEKSRMWFLLWVGVFTCSARLTDERSDRNWDIRWCVGLSRQMLKSLVIRNSWGVVAAKERNKLNPFTKTECGWSRRTVDVEDGKFGEFQKEQKSGRAAREVGSCAKDSLIINPVPLPVEDPLPEWLWGELSKV